MENVGQSRAPGSRTAGGGQANARSNRRQRQRTRRVTRDNLRNREGFFMHYLFVTLSVRYASYFKPTVRRLIEFFTLLKAIIMLSLLIYVHITFVKDSGHCLDDMKDIWPKEGVLKVQVEANSSLPPYQYFFARANSDMWASSFQLTPYQAVFKYSVSVGKDGLPRFYKKPPITPYDPVEWARKNVFGVKVAGQCPVINLSHFGEEKLSKIFLKKFSEITPKVHFLNPENAQEIPHWVLIDPSVSDTVAEFKMLQMQEVSGFHVGPQPVRDYYAIEYSPEFGYLRLSTVARFKLGVPVMVVTLGLRHASVTFTLIRVVLAEKTAKVISAPIPAYQLSLVREIKIHLSIHLKLLATRDPHRDECFGKGVKRWMLDTFFGYDDLIMGSIKRLAEQTNKDGGGYLRNLVTGEHFKFITLWVSHTSYFLAFIVMLVFTLLVTMLLRYSYHQIFVFMVELLHILDTDASPVFPAAPMLTIILALVGTEEIMTEFFHDSTLAFYVILSIWVADQFDAICMHTVISRRHWVRFFFFYHFAFYAYHYRYNGQFSELALFTSWLFIQHSMFYFLHHYEIPAIQRQIRLRQILFQNENIQNVPSNPPSQADSGDDTPPDGSQGSAPSSSGQENTNDSQPNPDTSPRSQNENADSVSNSPENPSEQSNDHSSNTLSACEVADLMNSSVPPESIDQADSPADDTYLIKQICETDLWVDYPVAMPVESTERNSVGIYKYCHLILVLFFALASLILIFSLSILMLNQGRLSAKFAGNNFEKLASFVQ